MRAGSPPSNTYMDMIDNWDEIIIAGCKGEIVQPKFTLTILSSDNLGNGYDDITRVDEFWVRYI